MSSKKSSDVACHNCKAPNPANYTYCYHCKALPKKGAKKPAAKKSAAKKKSAKR